MSLFASVLSQITSVKPLDKQILDILNDSDEPMDRSDILARMPVNPGRTTLSCKLLEISNSGKIQRLGEAGHSRFFRAEINSNPTTRSTINGNKN